MPRFGRLVLPNDLWTAHPLWTSTNWSDLKMQTALTFLRLFQVSSHKLNSLRDLLLTADVQLHNLQLLWMKVLQLPCTFSILHPHTKQTGMTLHALHTVPHKGIYSVHLISSNGSNLVYSALSKKWMQLLDWMSSHWELWICTTEVQLRSTFQE